MLSRRPSLSASGGRALQMLPLALAAAALAAMPARLLPVRPIALDIPSTLGIAPGAAPEYSVAPISRSPAVNTAVLPDESQPSAATPPGAELDAGAAAPSAQRVFLEAKSADEAWTDRLPRSAATAEASGNLKIHARQPTAISTLVASIMKSLSRLHASAVLSAKAVTARVAALKTPPRHDNLVLPTRAMPPKPNLAGRAVGGAGPLRNILGGPAPLAARYAPVVSGASVARYR